MFHGHDRSLSVLYVARWSRVRSPVPAGIQAPRYGAAWQHRGSSLLDSAALKSLLEAPPGPGSSQAEPRSRRIASFPEARGFLTLGRFHRDRVASACLARGSGLGPAPARFSRPNASHLQCCALGGAFRTSRLNASPAFGNLRTDPWAHYQLSHHMRRTLHLLCDDSMALMFQGKLTGMKLFAAGLRAVSTKTAPIVAVSALTPAVDRESLAKIGTLSA